MGVEFCLPRQQSELRFRPLKLFQSHWTMLGKKQCKCLVKKLYPCWSQNPPSETQYLLDQTPNFCLNPNYLCLHLSVLRSASQKFLNGWGLHKLSLDDRPESFFFAEIVSCKRQSEVSGELIVKIRTGSSTLRVKELGAKSIIHWKPSVGNENIKLVKGPRKM